MHEHERMRRFTFYYFYFILILTTYYGYPFFTIEIIATGFLLQGNTALPVCVGRCVILLFCISIKLSIRGDWDLFAYAAHIVTLARA